MSQAVNPYGDGQASERIVQHIKYYFNLQMTDLIILNLQKIYKMTNVNFCDKTGENLTRI